MAAIPAEAWPASVHRGAGPSAVVPCALVLLSVGWGSRVAELARAPARPIAVACGQGAIPGPAPGGPAAGRVASPVEAPGAGDGGPSGRPSWAGGARWASARDLRAVRVGAAGSARPS